MINPPIPARPPYRIALCPRIEADHASSMPLGVLEKFSAAEAAELSKLPERRRRDRVAGRLAAKRALAAHFSAEYGWDPAPEDLVLDNDADGRPLLRLPAGAPAPAPSFSLSHGIEGAVCAVAAPGRRVGVDIETVVSRPEEVIAFVAAPGEIAGAPSSDPEAQARLWTGKEAALKLLGLGLDADARDIRFEDGEVLFSGEPERAWRRLGSPRVRMVFERSGSAMIAVACTGD